MNPEQDQMTTPAEAEGKQESASTVSKQEQKSEPTIREKMFGGKVKHNDDKNEEAKNDDKDNSDSTDGIDSTNGGDGAGSKPDKGDKGGANAVENVPPQVHKKSAKERIQELAREKKSYKEQVSQKDQEIARLQQELQELQAKKEGRTSKDDYREVVIEEKLKENMRAIQTELQDYASKHKDPAMFETSYNYYMPVFNEHDPWTVTQISKFPEKIAMFDKFFESMNNGAFTMQEWISAPQPLKLKKLLDLQKIANGETDKPAMPKASNMSEVSKKKPVEDSVVPDLKKGGTSESIDKSKGSTFNKVFQRGRTR